MQCMFFLLFCVIISPRASHSIHKWEAAFEERPWVGAMGVVIDFHFPTLATHTLDLRPVVKKERLVLIKSKPAKPRHLLRLSTTERRLGLGRITKFAMACSKRFFTSLC